MGLVLAPGTRTTVATVANGSEGRVHAQLSFKLQLLSLLVADPDPEGGRRLKSRLAQTSTPGGQGRTPQGEGGSSGKKTREWCQGGDRRRACAWAQRECPAGDSPNLVQLHNLIGDNHQDQGQAAQEPC